MRTTIAMPDALLRRAKQEAARRGVTLAALVVEAVRVFLDGPRAPANVRLPTAGAPGEQLIDVDMANARALRELDLL